MTFLCSDKVLNLRASQFSCPESCIMHIARYFALVTPLAKDPLYRALHPYAAPTEKAFKSWNVGKQNAAEVRGKIYQTLFLCST